MKEKITRRAIRLLPKHIAERIAAGEVVERPASALREIIENAIDASSTMIDIEADEGGVSLLKITDNGVGINEEEIVLAITHHATSKIETFEELSEIDSFGFRGEALASIADVSRLNLISKTKEADYAVKLSVEGGEIIEKTIAAAVDGTCITIKNLFYNLPVRKKFLKSSTQEFIALKETTQAYAIMHYGIGFNLTHNSKKIFSFQKRDSFEERLKDFLGEKRFEAFMPISVKGPFFEAEGFISGFSETQSSFRASGCYINGRPVDNRSISYAIKSAYSGVIPKDRFPCFFIKLNIKPSFLDVNIHPGKREVKIKAEKEVTGALYRAIANALNRQEKRFGSVEIKMPNTSLPLYVAEPTIKEMTTKIKESRNQNWDTHKEYDNLTTNNQNIGTPYMEENRVLGQVFSSYIVVERGDNILFVDQHAAYERLNFEHIKKSILDEKIEFEELLIPLEFEYNTQDIESLVNMKNTLKDLGIEIEQISPTHIVLSRIPIFMASQKASSVVKEILEYILKDGESFQFTSFIDKYAETIACKASPKAGDNLSKTDMENLIVALDKEGLTTCPHGRPFLLRISKQTLERNFLR